MSVQLAARPRQKVASGLTLTRRQQQFVAHYCREPNATRAAINAGYSENGAGQTAHKLLKKAEIRLAIDERMDEVGMSAAEVTALLAAQARGAIPTKVTVTQGEPPVEVFDVHRALETIVRIRGLDRDGPTDGRLQIVLVSGALDGTGAP